MTQHPEQPDTGHQPVRQTGRPGRYHTLAAGIGIAAAMILCCAGPILIAAGALGAIAGFFSNPLVLLAAATVLLAGIIAVTRQRKRRRTDDCCPPHPPSTTAPTTAPPESPSPFLEGTTRHHDIPEIPPFSVRSPAQSPRLRPVSGSGHGTDNRLRQLTERPVGRARRFVARRGRCRCCYGLRH